MKLSWDYYIKRKRTNVDDLISAHNINSYAELRIFLLERSVIPPEEKEVSHLFKESPDKKEEVKKPIVKKKTRRTRRKRTKADDGIGTDSNK